MDNDDLMNALFAAGLGQGAPPSRQIKLMQDPATGKAQAMELVPFGVSGNRSYAGTPLEGSLDPRRDAEQAFQAILDKQAASTRGSGGPIGFDPVASGYASPAMAAAAARQPPTPSLDPIQARLGAPGLMSSPSGSLKPLEMLPGGPAHTGSSTALGGTPLSAAGVPPLLDSIGQFQTKYSPSLAEQALARQMGLLGFEQQGRERLANVGGENELKVQGLKNKGMLDVATLAALKDKTQMVQDALLKGMNPDQVRGLVGTRDALNKELGLERLGMPGPEAPAPAGATAPRGDIKLEMLPRVGVAPRAAADAAFQQKLLALTPEEKSAILENAMPGKYNPAKLIQTLGGNDKALASPTTLDEIVATLRGGGSGSLAGTIADLQQQLLRYGGEVAPPLADSEILARRLSTNNVREGTFGGLTMRAMPGGLATKHEIDMPNGKTRWLVRPNFFSGYNDMFPTLRDTTKADYKSRATAAGELLRRLYALESQK